MALWRYVAIPENKKICYFLYFFWLWRCGDMWRYVAIPQKFKKTVFFEVFFLRLWRCGDMWRYPKTRKSVIFCIFLVVALWRYVAICGETPKIKKTVFFEVFFLRLWRCGDMWRYPKTRKSVIFCIFLVVALWRYVAIPQKLKKQCFLKFFS